MLSFAPARKKVMQFDHEGLDSCLDRRRGGLAPNKNGRFTRFYLFGLSLTHLYMSTRFLLHLLLSPLSMSVKAESHLVVRVQRILICKDQTNASNVYWVDLAIYTSRCFQYTEKSKPGWFFWCIMHFLYSSVGDSQCQMRTHNKKNTQTQSHNARCDSALTPNPAQNFSWLVSPILNSLREMALAVVSLLCLIVISSSFSSGAGYTLSPSMSTSP